VKIDRRLTILCADPTAAIVVSPIITAVFAASPAPAFHHLLVRAPQSPVGMRDHYYGLFDSAGVRQEMVEGVPGVASADALAVTRLMRSLLFGISPLDPVAFTAMPTVLVSAAVLASRLPARHAVAVDAVETIRAE
jgi:hypothetical protein